MSIRVVTDTSCDLSDQLLAEHGIGLVPLRIRFGSEELVDREELPTKEFWSRARSFDGLPSTAAPSPGQFGEMFDKMESEGATGVVCINLSGKLSATIEAARQAAKDRDGKAPVRVIDSEQVTLGLGLQVLAAAEAANAGADLDGVVAAVESARSRLRVYGTFETLEYLQKGGRIGGAQAFVGSLLAIKPVIEIRDGEVQEESKQRTRGRSLKYLADKAKAADSLERVAVMGADAKDLDALIDQVKDLPAERPLLVNDIGPVIGSHTGPGTVGIAFLLAK